MDKRAQVENTYAYHAPKTDQVERCSRLRDKTKKLALLICDLTPESREQSLALTNLEYALTMAHAAIARNE